METVKNFVVGVVVVLVVIGAVIGLGYMVGTRWLGIYSPLTSALDYYFSVGAVTLAMIIMFCILGFSVCILVYSIGERVRAVLKPKKPDFFPTPL